MAETAEERNLREFREIHAAVMSMPARVWGFDGGKDKGKPITAWRRFTESARILWEYDGGNGKTIWRRLVETSEQQAVVLDALKALEVSVREAAATPGSSPENVAKLVLERISDIKFSLQPETEVQAEPDAVGEVK